MQVYMHMIRYVLNIYVHYVLYLVIFFQKIINSKKLVDKLGHFNELLLTKLEFVRNTSDN